MRVYAVIPARSGSKELPHKNIRPLHGHPLLAWSVAAALACTKISRTFVSTDSEEYAGIARQYGAEVPFLRPVELARDNSSDGDFLIHAITWWKQHSVLYPDLIVLLRPTTPLREPSILDKAITKIQTRPDATSLCSGFLLPESPVKHFGLAADGFFRGFMGDEYLSLRRQDCPEAYAWDGYVDILRTEYVIEHPDDIFGQRRLAMITPAGVEIDTIEQFEFIEFLAQEKGHSLLALLEKGTTP